MNKLKPIHITIIGTVVCLIAAVALFFLLIKPANEARDKQNAELSSTIDQGGTEQAVLDAQQKLAQMKIKVAQDQAELTRWMKAKMPNISLDDPARGMLAIWQEYSETLGPLLIGWIGGKDKTNVHLASGLSISAPSSDPTAYAQYIEGSAPLTINIGKVKIEGDYSSIMKHLRKWNDCNRLCLINEPAISGTSPNLSCEYTLTVYIYPVTAYRAENLPPIAAAAAGASGDGSMVGGMPGTGMPGMPTPGM